MEKKAPPQAGLFLCSLVANERRRIPPFEGVAAQQLCLSKTAILLLCVLHWRLS